METPTNNSRIKTSHPDNVIVQLRALLGLQQQDLALAATISLRTLGYLEAYHPGEVIEPKDSTFMLLQHTLNRKLAMMGLPAMVGWQVLRDDVLQGTCITIEEIKAKQAEVSATQTPVTSNEEDVNG